MAKPWPEYFGAPPARVVCCGDHRWWDEICDDAGGDKEPYVREALARRLAWAMKFGDSYQRRDALDAYEAALGKVMPEDMPR